MGVASRRGRAAHCRGGRFVHQALALEDTEAVLLINGDKAEPIEFDGLLDEACVPMTSWASPERMRSRAAVFSEV